VVGLSGTGAGFLRVLRFPLQSSFAPPITPQSPSYIIRGMLNRPMCGCSAGTYRDLGDLKKGPNWGVSPTRHKNRRHVFIFPLIRTLIHVDEQK
jgi:hypothetical protein